ncbi:MAG: DNA (cytosine-5-)-methyltransferase [Candidatus Woykebacteria bacterium]
MFKFIDLFAGIGGIRIGFEKAGGKSVWSNDYDKHCGITYKENFGDKDFVLGDISKIPASDIPDFDILCAGFPCQPFSIAGISKKNSLNRPNGFRDEAQGTLFYEILRILKEKKPAAFFLENVKNLERHDKGKTFEVIKGSLAELGYSFFYKIINAKFLVPQSRERIFMIGFRDEAINFEFPEIKDAKPKVRNILEAKVSDKYTLSDKLWKYLRDYAKKHKEKGNGFGYGIVDLDGVSRTLSARYHKDGSEILVPQKGENPRRLTPRECARLQGFPDDFKIPVSDTQAYRQFGNAVAVPVIEVLAKQLARYLKPGKKIMNAKQKETSLTAYTHTTT